MTVASNNPICIIGMHRSGTSMVARLLSLCGLNLGPEDQLLGPSRNNVMGHFEHLGFLGLNETLLKHFGGSWDSPPVLKRGWENDPSLEKVVCQAREILATFSGISCWGWKDPRTTILLPFWQKLVPNLRHIICMRNPLEVARSLAARDGMSITGATELWYHYSRAAINNTDGCSRLLSFYEDYFTNPLQEFDRVAGFCGFDGHKYRIGVHEIISRPLRHQSIELVELLKEDRIPLEYKLFYFGLRVLSLEKPFTKGHGRARGENTEDGPAELLRLMTEFRETDKTAQLEANLAATEQMLNKSQATVREREREVLNLEKDNARLQAFSDAVRGTWAYRSYRKLIRPFKLA